MDTSTVHNVAFFLVATACGAGQFLDCWTTDVGLSNGYVEKTSLVAKIQSKIGSTGYFIVKCMAIPGIGAALFATVSFAASLIWLAPLTAYGFVAGIKNYLLLKKNKVKVF